MDSTERGALLYNLAELVQKNRELFCTIETWDNGKTYGSSEHDVDDTIKCLKYYAGWTDKIHGQTIQTSGAKLAYTIREPIGVCGQIIP
jgi:aldehyde dehydrogenase (NAD+)